ncbi:DUF6531 domain-containing protein [Enterobacteriaceae bacterium ESL0689]|nr:DUF6531 domain-containing protein [Enterobacteriaceae bacterium ESL0689]
MVHSGLDIIGAVPVVGILADGVNAVIYTAEGEYGQAALSATSAVVNLVPGAGGIFKAGKMAARINKALGKTSAVKAVEKTALQAEKTAVKAESRAAGKSASHTLSAKKAGSEKGGSHQSRNSRKSEPCKIPAEPLSPLTGHPVNAILGIKVLYGDEDNDFDFPAAIPLTWQRYYFSDEISNGWLGQGWFLPLSLSVRQQDDMLIFTDEQGWDIRFPCPPPGELPVMNRYEQLKVSRPEEDTVCICAADESRHWHFSHQPRPGHWLLSAITDRNENRLTIDYNSRNQPEQITDSAGRRFLIEFSSLSLTNGGTVERITGVSVCHPSDPLSADRLCQYDYSSEGDLIAVRNGQGAVLREFRYQQHMLTAHRLAGELACF